MAIADDHYRFERFQQAEEYYDKVIERDTGNCQALLKKHLCSCWITHYYQLNMEELGHYYERTCLLCKEQKFAGSYAQFIMDSASWIYGFYDRISDVLLNHAKDSRVIQQYGNFFVLSRRLIQNLQEVRIQNDTAEIQELIENIIKLTLNNIAVLRSSQSHLSEEILRDMEQLRQAFEPVLLTLPNHLELLQKQTARKQAIEKFWQEHASQKEMLNQAIIKKQRQKKWKSIIAKIVVGICYAASLTGFAIVRINRLPIQEGHESPVSGIFLGAILLAFIFVMIYGIIMIIQKFIVKKKPSVQNRYQLYLSDPLNYIDEIQNL